MTHADFDGTIEIVRGQMTEARADQILGFWSREGVLEGEAARQRLSEVVCVLVDGGGEIAGVNSVFAANVPLIGGRQFWIYRRFLVGDASSAEQAMITTAFTALEKEFEPSEAGPIGLCVLVADPAEMERHPQAIWPETELMFAGYLKDDRQARIRYFWEAPIGAGLENSPPLSTMRDYEYPIEDRYAIEVFAETDAVSHDDVIALWESEGVVNPAEAQRRAHEVHLVAVERTGGVVGISTAYLERNPQLRMDLWHYRVFVAREHRSSHLMTALAMEGRDSLKQRFVSGEDTRAAGMIYEIENEGLKRYFNTALWLPAEFTFIGENKRGDHVRVHYFPGALAPAPK
jgi:hypothetical protein